MPPSDVEPTLATILLPSSRDAAAQTPISAVLSHGGVHVGLDAEVEGLAEVLLLRRVSTAAVTNDFGAVVGVISSADLAASADPAVPAGTTVRELMHDPGSLLAETASVASAAARMAGAGATELPIACSECGSICVLFARDILDWLAEPSAGPPQSPSLPTLETPS